MSLLQPSRPHSHTNVSRPDGSWPTSIPSLTLRKVASFIATRCLPSRFMPDVSLVRAGRCRSTDGRARVGRADGDRVRGELSRHTRWQSARCAARWPALANDCGMDAEGIAAVRLAVTEAATNAVDARLRRRARRAEGHRRRSRTANSTIVIGDTGRGLVEKRDSPGLGAGLAIIASVAQAPEDRQRRARHTDSHGVPVPERQASRAAATRTRRSTGRSP